MMEGGGGNSELLHFNVEPRLTFHPSSILMVKTGGGVLYIFQRSLVENGDKLFKLGCLTFHSLQKVLDENLLSQKLYLRQCLV